MAVQHHYSVRSPVLPSGYQGASDGTHLVLPYGRTSVGVWKLNDLTAKVNKYTDLEIFKTTEQTYL